MLALQIALAAGWFLLFSVIVYKGAWFRIAGVNQKLVLGSFWLKLIFGLLFWLVYNFHYTVDHTSDAFSYFTEGQLLNDIFWENPVHFFRLLFSINPSDPELQQYLTEFNRWNRAVNYGVINDNPSIIKFNAIVSFFSLGFYHTHTIFMGFVCFSGLILTHRFFAWFSNLPPLLILAAVILPPSLLFWSGGVLKEGLLIFGLGLLLYSFTQLHQKKYLCGIALACLAVFLLVFTKVYVLIAFAPAFIFFLWMQHTKPQKIWVKFILVHVLLFAAVFSLHLWVDDYNVLHMFQQKQRDFYSLGQLQEVGSMIEIPPIHHIGDLVLNAPVALFNTYFRPHLLEAEGASYLASAVENLLYMLLLITAIIKFSKPQPRQLVLMLTCLSCLVGLGLLVGLITPVLGAVVRYKIPALPFFVIMCFLLMQPWLSSLNSLLIKIQQKF